MICWGFKIQLFENFQIFRKPHSTTGKFAPKKHLFYQSIFICYLVPQKRIIFAKVQRRIKSKIRLSYRLSFKLLVVNKSNMPHQEVELPLNILNQILLFHCIAAKSRCSRDVSSSVAL